VAPKAPEGLSDQAKCFLFIQRCLDRFDRRTDILINEPYRQPDDSVALRLQPSLPS
jgi:hypothetical protein